MKIDRRFVDAGLRLAIGLVEPHFMAGFSGGRKLITPGIAHADTIGVVHSSAFMAHPGCRNLNLEGNPLHEEQLEVLRMLPPPPPSALTGLSGPPAPSGPPGDTDTGSSPGPSPAPAPPPVPPPVLGFNVVLAPDRSLAHAAFGEICASHADAVAVAREHATVPAPRRFKTVVTSAAGLPLDKTFYQVYRVEVGLPVEPVQPWHGSLPV